MLYVADSLTATPRVLVDPNGKREDATIALSQWSPSPDGESLAYALSDGGTDWNIWHFRRVADGVDLPVDAQVQQVLAGLLGARQLGRLLQPLSAEAEPGRRRRERGDDAGRPDVYFHELGEPQSADRLVFKVTDHPTRVPSAQVTEDGRYLIIGLFDGYEANGVLVQDLRKRDAKPQPLFMAWDALYNFLGSQGDELYFQTTNGAPRGRVIAVDAGESGAGDWRTVVPQGDFTINNARTSAAASSSNTRATRAASCACSRRDGTAAGEVKLPGLGTADGFQGSGDEPGDVLLVLGLSVADARAAARRRDQHRERFPHAERAGGLLAVSSPSRCSTPARTARACRCSSRAARTRRATAISR